MLEPLNLGGNLYLEVEWMILAGALARSEARHYLQQPPVNDFQGDMRTTKAFVKSPSYVRLAKDFAEHRGPYSCQLQQTGHESEALVQND